MLRRENQGGLRLFAQGELPQVTVGVGHRDAVARGGHEKDRGGLHGKLPLVLRALPAAAVFFHLDIESADEEPSSTSALGQSSSSASSMPETSHSTAAQNGQP